MKKAKIIVLIFSFLLIGAVGASAQLEAGTNGAKLTFLQSSGKVQGVVSLKLKLEPASAYSGQTILLSRLSGDKPVEVTSCKKYAEGAYVCTFNSVLLKNGEYSFQASAVYGDAVIKSNILKLNISNPAPAVVIRNLRNRQKIKGIVNISVKQLNARFNEVKIVNPQTPSETLSKCNVTKYDWQCVFNTATLKNGIYQLQAVTPDNVLSQIVSVEIVNPAAKLMISKPGNKAKAKGPLTFYVKPDYMALKTLKINQVSASGATEKEIADCKPAHDNYWSCAFDTRRILNGSYYFQAKGLMILPGATLALGSEKDISSQILNITINNPVPKLEIISPRANSKVKSIVTVKARQENEKFIYVELMRVKEGGDSRIVGCSQIVKSNDWSCAFDSSALSNGTYKIYAKATYMSPVNSQTTFVNSNQIALIIENAVKAATKNYGERCTADDVCAVGTLCKQSGRYPVTPNSTHSESYCCKPMECASVIPETVYKDGAPLPPFHCVVGGGTDTLMDGRKATCDGGILYPQANPPAISY